MFFCVNDFIYSSRKDGSKPSVSCLNFEPKVSKFPVLEVEATSNTAATMKIHYFCYGREKRLDEECESGNDFVYSSKEYGSKLSVSLLVLL